MTPDQAQAAAQLVGQHLQQEWKTTYKVLTALPEDKKEFKPEEHARGAFELAKHLAAADVWFLEGVINGAFDKPNEPSASTVSELGDWYKQNFPKTLERALALDGPKLAQTVDFFGMKMPAVNYLLFALVHMVHHRGQLSTYLRPCGGKVPSIYGGSYDEPWTGPPDANA